MRRLLFGIVFTLVMALGQVAMAASATSKAPYASPGTVAILVGVLTVAIFLWIYSFIA